MAEEKTINEEKIINEETKTNENNLDSEKENVDNEKTNLKEDKNKKKNKLLAKLEELEKENKDLKDQLLRNRAELENFKKRITDEKIKERKYASLDLVRDLVSVVDNLDLACNMETEDQVLKNFLIGFKMINTQIFDVLEKDGLKLIEAKDKFDENYHQAVAVEEKENVEPGLILEQYKRGYMYKDRIIRPAMVKVSK